MKLLLPFALFFAISVEGHLRGDHSPGDDMLRSLKGCSGKKMGKCMESAPTPSTNLVREPQSPALAGVSTVLETCAQAAGFQSAEDVVPCFSQGDCDGYDTEFGEPCCLASRCICGSTADANPCANFGSGSGFSSSVTVPTVPTILPTMTMTVPTTPSPSPAPTLTLDIVATTIVPTSAPAAPSPPTPSPPTPVPPTPSPPTPAPPVVFETCAQAKGFQSAEDVVPCFSQADCADYDAEFGEPCCLASRCICGSTADANRCASFGPSGGFSSSITVPTVPTVLP